MGLERTLPPLLTDLPTPPLLTTKSPRSQEPSFSPSSSPLTLPRHGVRAGDGLSQALAPFSPFVKITTPETSASTLLASSLPTPLVCASKNKSTERPSWKTWASKKLSCRNRFV